MDENRVTSRTVAMPHETSLQRAWSEIQRELGHESAETLPSRMRRRFVRLAGLIELADEEVADIREHLARYDGGPNEGLNHSIDEGRLDKPALRVLIRDSRRVRRADREIAKRLGSKLGCAWVIDADVERLRDLDFRSIGAVDRALATREGTVVSFAVAWVQAQRRPVCDWEVSYFSRGVTLLYLWYVMLAETGDSEVIARAIEKHEDMKGESLDAWVAQVIDAYRAATA